MPGVAALLAGLVLLGVVTACMTSGRTHPPSPSGHFDGERFFNPGGADDTAWMPKSGTRLGYVWRHLTKTDGRPEWPGSIEVARAKPVGRIDGDRMVATWVGHATVLVQTQGLNILTDPVWSDRVGPFGLGVTRVAAPGIRMEDLPRIDLILLSHNHYDHMDKVALRTLWARDRPLIVAGLGNDRDLSGIDVATLDWGESVRVRGDISVTATRNHHQSGRGVLDRNRALWSAFVVTLPGGNLYFAGDTGMGDGKWPYEAAALGPIRYALIPIGAFRFEPGQMGAGDHIGPVDAIRAFERSGASRAMAIHWGTFPLSQEGRDTPALMLEALLRCGGGDPSAFKTVRIGESVEVPGHAEPRRKTDQAIMEACLASPDILALR
ncbi:L-ascorbate metabolism protein UlaG (beta-lactamase superfamily) [Methylobacterium brachiatum]|uniref:L-ascorbate metabolism protein UlaG (Beta-lactamase superfamily) n=1 Tax=Methylobacterium brachiatum TaxID=269660 RepID=A0AAJ1TQZ3_9HYPH|nr:MBL fold metallo-hydrolase [Methylobacterium brachiatum]MCB4802200.1 MBL fold metallo-hydrolase [Methylobacterium brachiatum]MDQ0542543.1 L-ascorbate metabolism protein UlaG (beta-lactamase superfamily) [Methylobacterium brachiatum]